jgi:hypothetical protein
VDERRDDFEELDEEDKSLLTDGSRRFRLLLFTIVVTTIAAIVVTIHLVKFP